MLAYSQLDPEEEAEESLLETFLCGSIFNVLKALHFAYVYFLL